MAPCHRQAAATAGPNISIGSESTFITSYGNCGNSSPTCGNKAMISLPNLRLPSTWSLIPVRVFAKSTVPGRTNFEARGASITSLMLTDLALPAPRDNPGNLIRSGGDIDNRIKVLLDGLKMPQIEADLGGFPIAEDENPFFCLLEDDSLITSLSVTADRLLMPQTGDGHSVHDIFLVIRVTIVNESAIFADGRIV
jgi:hypothetical protein